jgi:Mg/Co/Ni transporter MgtE
LFNSVDVREDVIEKLEEEELDEVMERMDIDWSIAENI